MASTGAGSRAFRPARERARTRPLGVARWLGFLLGVGLLGCSDGVLGPEADELAEARARWVASNSIIYAFEFQRFCFCGGDTVRPVRIEVISGAVNTAVFVDTGEAVADLASVPTIDDLFDEIQEAIDREAHSIAAEYDEALGYPISVSIDFILEAIDEEMAFAVSSFTFPLQQARVAGA